MSILIHNLLKHLGADFASFLMKPLKSDGVGIIFGGDCERSVNFLQKISLKLA